MGAWYWIGVSVGVGAAVGVFLSGIVPIPAVAIVVGAVAAAAVGVALDLWQGSWVDVVGCAVGAAVGALGSVQIVRGALRRGGTRGGIAALVTGISVVVAGLAFVPVLGYLEALALPMLAARLHRRAPERYAGLRTLARD
jgi:hypothetical protein